MLLERYVWSGSLRDLLYVASHPQARLIEGLRAAGWDARVAGGLDAAREICADRQISVGVVDLTDASAQGLHLAALLAACERNLEWVALVSPDCLERAEIRDAVTRYCYDYTTMPVPLDRLAVTLGHAHGMADLYRLASRACLDLAGRHGIIGTSAEIETVRRSIETFAATDAPVLIMGETGTGKELTASAIHALSRRRDCPLIAVNCGALPPSLIQSELFGYERGAFTGADRRVIGKFEAANTGTIFLDEIGDLPPELQVNLLRFLQEHRVQRVGGHSEIELDLRIIAATNVDLERAVRDGRFREDLYYRLNVLLLKLPPLRERIEDIELLAEHIFELHFHERRSRVKGFGREGLAAMRRHSWPGNVRELINRVRRAVITCERPLIGVEELGLSEGAETVGETLRDARCRAELDAIARALQLTCGNVSDAARRLDVTRATLYRLMRKYRIASPGETETSMGLAVAPADALAEDPPRPTRRPRTNRTI